MANRPCAGSASVSCDSAFLGLLVGASFIGGCAALPGLAFGAGCWIFALLRLGGNGPRGVGRCCVDPVISWDERIGLAGVTVRLNAG